MENKLFGYMFLCSIALLTTGFTDHHTILDNRACQQDNTEKADLISVKNLKSLLRTGSDLQIIDVRLKKDLDKTQVIPTARWQDPGLVDQWAKSLDKSKPVVVYCVHGHQVSRQVVDRLRQSGFSAQRLEGGIQAWKDQKGAITILKE